MFLRRPPKRARIYSIEREGDNESKNSEKIRNNFDQEIKNENHNKNRKEMK